MKKRFSTFILILTLSFTLATPTYASTFDVSSFITIYNKILSLLHNNISSQVGQVVASNSGLVAQYEFEGNANDSIGGNNGTVVGSAIYSAGKVGQGLQLNAVNRNYVDLSSPSSMDFSSTNAFTISAWVYPTSVAPSQVVFARNGVWGSANIETYFLNVYHGDNTRWYARISDGINEVKSLSSVGTVSPNEWQHIAMVWDGTTLRIYKNGVAIASGSNASFTKLWDGTANRKRTSIGGDGQGSQYYWNGSIDEVRVYNRALSSSELSELASVSNVSQTNNSDASTPVNVPMVDVYVSPNGSDSSLGTASAPLLTLDRALQIVNPGGTIHLAAGVYATKASSKKDGTSNAPITIVGAGPSTTVTSGKITIAHSNYRISGIKIEGGLELYGSGAHNSVIENNEFTAGVQGLSFSLPDSDAADGTAGPAFNTVRNNLFYRPTGGVMIVLLGHDNLISHNTFKESNGWDVMRVWGKNQTIADNSFEDTVTSQTTTGGNHADIIQTFGSSRCLALGNIIFERNVIKGNTGQFGNLENKRSDGYLCPSMGDITFRNNIFVNSRIQLNNYLPNVKIYNNTIYKAPDVIGFRFAASNNGQRADNGRVYNNLFVRVGSLPNNGFYGFNTATVGGMADYNFVSGQDDFGKDTEFFNEAHGINGGYTPEQIFVNPVLGDFRLKQGSPAVNAGITISGFVTDKNNVTRPQGQTWDIGAYEYVGEGAGVGQTQTPVYTPTPLPSSMVTTYNGAISNSSAGTATNTKTPFMSVSVNPTLSINIPSGTSAVSLKTNYHFTRNLKLGSRGNDVLELQKYLNTHGFTVATQGSGSPGNETTYFGPATYKAVVKFQEVNRIAILAPYKLTKGTGFVGPATLKVLNTTSSTALLMPLGPNATAVEIIEYIKQLMRGH